VTIDNGSCVKEPHVFGDVLPRCPACGAAEIEPVVERGASEVHFFCRACARCWLVELGFVQRLSPHECYGCSRYDQCVAQYRADHA
jgi:hypothetical protein